MDKPGRWYRHWPCLVDPTHEDTYVVAHRHSHLHTWVRFLAFVRRVEELDGSRLYLELQGMDLAVPPTPTVDEFTWDEAKWRWLLLPKIPKPKKQKYPSTIEAVVTYAFCREQSAMTSGGDQDPYITGANIAARFEEGADSAFCDAKDQGYLDFDSDGLFSITRKGVAYARELMEKKKS